MGKINAAVFLADGFEDIEAIAVIDLLRRAGFSVTSVSLTNGEYAASSHGVTVKADALFGDLGFGGFDILILPGGPGYKKYSEHTGLCGLLKRHNDENRYIAAICAAPTVLGRLGILKGKTAVCYPGMESGLSGAAIGAGPVEHDGNIITSKSAGTTVPFALKIIEVLAGTDAANEISKGICYP